MNQWSFRKFWLMIATSAVAMYLVMYANVYEFSHIYSATMRVYMTVLMVVPMILIMLGFMRSMYSDSQKKRWIVIVSSVVWVLVFIGIRTQVWIGDVAWMRAMIPHHSSAILTSSRATLEDPEVKQLANEIIEAQEREIAQMKKLIEKLQ